jgi:hypothetical protein
MTTGFDPAEEFSADTREAVFLIAFTDDEGPLCMEAAGELDNPEYRAAIVMGLRELADKIETDAHEHSH